MKLPKIDITELRKMKDLYSKSNEYFSKQYQFCIARRNFIGYKKVAGGKVIRLLIPKGTKVYVTNDKCRARKAIPLDNGTSLMHHWPVIGNCPNPLEYKKGKLVVAREDQHSPHSRRYNFDARRVCAPGIHFFAKYEDALDYAT